MIARALLIFAMTFVALALSSRDATAEPVYIEANELVGQGWIFKRGDQCLVLTAGHVAQVGAVVNSTRKHPDGRSLQGQATRIQVHPRANTGGEGAVDLGILVLEGALKAQCPASQLGYTALGPTLDRIQRTALPVVMTRALLDTGIASTPVRIHTINADGISFVVDKAVGASGALQGDSGSVLQLQSGGVGESGLPLGIVVQALGESGLIRAVRFDVARNFVEQAFPIGAAPGSPATRTAPVALARAPLELTDFVGSVPDPSCGPTAALAPASRCGWKEPLAGDRRFADLIVTTAGGFPRLSVFEATLSGNGGSVGVEISTSDASAAETTVWTTASVCRGISNTRLSCQFAERSARSVRLRFFGDISAVMHANPR